MLNESRVSKRLFVVCTVVLGLALLAPAANVRAQEYYAVTQGSFSTIVEPLTSAEAAVSFYSYGVGAGVGIGAGTGYEKPDTSLLFLYRDTLSGSGDLSLFMIHDWIDSDGGYARLDFSGLPQNAAWIVEDDRDFAHSSQYDRYFPASAVWRWWPCCTDGGVLSDVDGFTEITITPTFYWGIRNWVVLTGDVNNPTYISLPNLTDPVTISIAEVQVAIDIKPQSCPNPVNVASRGVLPVAMLGTAELDVNQVDVASIRLAGVQPLRSAIEDVATPYESLAGKEDALDCIEEGPDGFLDLTLKFDTPDVIQAIEGSLGREMQDGETVIVSLSGKLLDGMPLVGEDVVVILKKGKK